MGAARTGTIVFTGFMGAGKSRALRRARESGLDGVDVDEVLERELGSPIEAFFAERGEAEFRRREEEAALRALAEGHQVVALGGGAVLSERVRAALRRHSVVWLRVEPDELWRRARGSGRPLATDRAGFARLYAEREQLYREHAAAVLLSADAVPRALPSLLALDAAGPVRLLWAETASAEYPAWVGDGALRTATWPAAGKRYCVTDRVVAPLYAAALEPLAGRIEVEAGESAKTMASAESVLRELARAGMTRRDHVVALGGGVVGDLAGFCAATYQRGVAVVQVPTTLLAQVDSAYGGKTGVDLPEAKNYVGAYHQPAGVIADTSTLASLPAAELAAGFVEALKTGLIAGGAVWEAVRSQARLDPDALAGLVFDCAVVKSAIVAADERDAGRRQALNLGHTIGHAIEAAGGYGHRHGEAVGLGLLAALRLSGADSLRAEVAGLLARHQLPTTLDSAVVTDDVLAAAGRDKKLVGGGANFVLCERPGEVRTGAEVDEGSLRAAMEELRG